MGWRFRKSIKILPGVRVNLNTKGVGASFGVPGTGLSYVVTSGDTLKAARTPVGLLIVVIGVLLLVIAGLVYSQYFNAKPEKKPAHHRATKAA